MPTITKAINVTARCNILFRAEKLADLGLKQSQVAIIAKVCRTPGLSQEQIARTIYINKSNVTRQLGRLEKMGYVRRESSPTDRRVTLVYPTEKAAAIYPRIRAMRREWHDYLTEGLTSEDLAQVEAVLTRIMERATAYAGAELDAEELE